MNTNLNSLLNDLLRQGKLKKQEVAPAYIEGLLHGAENNFRSAEANSSRYSETAFKAAYDGILQISRAVIFINGLRPHGVGQHKTTFVVAGAFIGEKNKELIRKIDRYRKRRNENIYHPIDLISDKEAEAIIDSAKEYYHLVKDYFEKIDPQLKLFDF